MYAIHGSEDWRPDPNAGCRTALLHHHCPPLSHCLYTQYHVPLKLACRPKTIKFYVIYYMQGLDARNAWLPILLLGCAKWHRGMVE